ncbi:MAG: hypothetical protein J5J06_15205, partial [Phycisphaerae bacterium]|nr:hypothetical protein [Phycisphaerae bacterium]
MSASRVSAVALTAVLLISVHAKAQDHCDCRNSMPQVPADGAGGDCSDPDNFFAGWWPLCGGNSSGTSDGSSPGDYLAPLNLNLQFGAVSPDFPPLSVDPLASTAPLVSGEVRHLAGPIPYPERVLSEGGLDAATGQFLYRAVDFQLPFGGAVFRHVRTFAERMYGSQTEYGMLEDEADHTFWGAQGRFWDWNGLSWVMSENPLFLFEAHPYYAVGDTPQTSTPKRCYLIPDGHHSIPFIWSDGTGQYTAPPWFDARLTIEDSGSGKHAIIRLHRSSIVYRFKIRDEKFSALPSGRDPHSSPDAPAWDWESLNCGVPHYGLIESISDRYGNVIRYFYSDVSQSDGCEGPGWADSHGGGVCEPCCQNANEKGQIKAIKLCTSDGAGGETVVYTLLYTHRKFGFYRGHGFDHLPWTMQNAVHTIHVFSGDVDPLPNGNLTLDVLDFCDLDFVDPSDPDAPDFTLDEFNSLNHPDVPTNWILEARYLYQNTGNPGNECDLERLAIHNDWWSMGGALIKATVTDRRTSSIDGQGNSEPARRHSLYRYNGLAATGEFFPLLREVYEPNTVAAIVNGMRLYDDDPSLTVDDLLTDGPGRYVRVDPENPDVSPGSNNQAAVVDLADMSLELWGWNTFDPRPLDYGALRDALQLFVGVPLLEADWRGEAMRLVIDRRYGYGKERLFAHYFIASFPENKVPIGDLNGLYVSETMTSLLHFPFFIPHTDRPDNCTGLWTNELDRGFWIGIVDEIGRKSNGTLGLSYDVTQPNGDPPILTRNVYHVNPAGFLVKQRRYEWPDDVNDPVVDRVYGSGEENEYDDKGRLVETRSAGWSAPSNPDPASEGAIVTYKYYPDSGDEPGELQAVCIKEGTSGAEFLRDYYVRNAGRPDLIKAEYRYAANTVAWSGAFDAAWSEWTKYLYQLDGTGEDAPIIERTVVQAPTDAAPGLDYCGVQVSIMDDKGNETWYGVGSIPEGDAEAAPVNTANAFEFFWNSTTYDAQGKGLRMSQTIDSATLPGSYQRISRDPATATALDLTTEFEYGTWDLLEVVHYPDGTRKIIKDRMLANDPISGESVDSFETRYLWIYNGVSADGQTCTLPIELNRLDGGRLKYRATIDPAAFDGNADGYEPNIIPPGSPNTHVIKQEIAKLDAMGRVIGMETVGAEDLPPLEAQIDYNGFGNIGRSRDVDGTILRNVHDQYGRLWKVYRGSSDFHVYWGADCDYDESDPDGDPPDCDDDMVLVEKRYYGNDVTNAGELTRVRRYDSRITMQYEGGDEEAHGRLEDIIYDWRMRPVKRIEQADDGTVLRTHVTWYDHLDREAFKATYDGSAALTNVDPAGFLSGQALPTAAGIIQADNANPPALVSLMEYRFDARGNPAQTLTYDLSDPNGATTQSVTRYYDHANRPIEIHQIGMPVMRTVYDAKGRPVVSEQLAGGLPIARNETIFDDGDRPVFVTRLERTHDDLSGATLGVGNAVATYTKTVYDIDGRPTDQYDYGTGGSDFSTAALLDANDPIPGTARHTSYGYDPATGKQVSVTYPDGTTVDTERDSFDRVLMETTSRDGVRVAQTAYLYECMDVADPSQCDNLGRLLAIASVDVALQPNFDSATDIPWDAPPAGVQVTRFAYDAIVYDAAGYDGTFDPADQMSSGSGWISAVFYPDPATGGMPAEPSYQFAYYSDGTIARREDANGNVLYFEYDDLRQLRAIDIDIEGRYPAVYEPTVRPARIEFDYHPSGAPDAIRVFDAYGVKLSDVTLAYDGFGNPTYEDQGRNFWIHSGDLNDPDKNVWRTAGEETVVYGWDPLGDRLDTITYPARMFDGVARVITLDYAGNNFDNALNRVSRIIEGTNEVADFTYMGVARRAAMTLGNGLISQSFGAGGTTGYPGLDPFGRIRDLAYFAGAQLLHQYEYAYDLAGNREYARVTQWPYNGYDQENDRSWRYTHDDRNRLDLAKFGALAADNSDVTRGSALAPEWRSYDWRLDGFGNWFDSLYGIGLVTSIDVGDDGIGDGGSLQNHEVDWRNQIAEITGNTGAGEFAYDPMGNLVCDGDYFYQYDAFHRLIQINEFFDDGIPQFSQFSVDGTPLDPNDVGPVLARFCYDGLGRLITIDQLANALGDKWQQIDLYYDGFRRIQESIYTPSTGGIGGFGDMMEMFGGTGGPSPTQYATVDYIWAPDEVDQLLVQLKSDVAQPHYALTDASHNVTALVDGAGNVRQQWAYNPYGQPIARDQLLGGYVNRIGFQGLPFVNPAARALV